MRYCQQTLLLIVLCLIAECFSMTLLDAYNSARYSRKRQGMLNTRFNPVAHQRGEDDWQKQLGQARLVDKIMDENGVLYEVDNPINGKVSSYFNGHNTGRTAGGLPTV